MASLVISTPASSPPAPLLPLPVSVIGGPLPPQASPDGDRDAGIAGSVTGAAGSVHDDLATVIAPWLSTTTPISSIEASPAVPPPMPVIVMLLAVIFDPLPVTSTPKLF